MTVRAGRTDDGGATVVVEPVRRNRPVDPSGPESAFTVDVEDWYQSCVDYDAPITDRVVRNVDRILTLLDDVGIRGTFFVQGRVAEAFPRLVETIVAQGHELQSHGYSHRPLFAMNRAQLRDELERARKTVEDAGGTEVTSFRAQDFSIVAGNIWALEAVAEAGFTIDSSIFPMRTRRYGIAGWEVGPHRVELGDGYRILEVPVAVWTRGRWRVPVGGGGYFRVLPGEVLERALRAIVAGARPPIVYCHPYEFNPDELEEYAASVPRRVLLAQGLGRPSVTRRLRRLFEGLRFGRFDDVLTAWEIS